MLDEDEIHAAIAKAVASVTKDASVSDVHVSGEIKEAGGGHISVAYSPEDDGDLAGINDDNAENDDTGTDPLDEEDFQLAEPTRKGGFEFSVKVAKVQPEKQMIFGWASVTSVDGKEIVDKQGDAIQLQDSAQDGSHGLESAVYDFVLYKREHGTMHEDIGTGKLVESMVFTPEKAALGLIAKNEKGEPMLGWWVGFKIDRAETWADHKAGNLPEMSIGGRAIPHEVA